MTQGRGAGARLSFLLIVQIAVVGVFHFVLFVFYI